MNRKNLNKIFKTELNESVLNEFLGPKHPLVAAATDRGPKTNEELARAQYPALNQKKVIKHFETNPQAKQRVLDHNKTVADKTIDYVKSVPGKINNAMLNGGGPNDPLKKSGTSYDKNKSGVTVVARNKDNNPGVVPGQVSRAQAAERMKEMIEQNKNKATAASSSVAPAASVSGAGSAAAGYTPMAGAASPPGPSIFQRAQTAGQNIANSQPVQQGTSMLRTGLSKAGEILKSNPGTAALAIGGTAAAIYAAKKLRRRNAISRCQRIFDDEKRSECFKMIDSFYTD